MYLFALYIIYIYIVEVTQQSVEIKDKNGMQTAKQWHQQIRNCYLRTCGQGRLAALDIPFEFRRAVGCDAGASPCCSKFACTKKHQLQKHGRVTTPMLAVNETQNVSQLQTELKLGPICPT